MEWVDAGAFKLFVAWVVVKSFGARRGGVEVAVEWGLDLAIPSGVKFSFFIEAGYKGGEATGVGPVFLDEIRGGIGMGVKQIRASDGTGVVPVGHTRAAIGVVV